MTLHIKGTVIVDGKEPTHTNAEVLGNQDCQVPLAILADSRQPMRQWWHELDHHRPAIPKKVVLLAKFTGPAGEPVWIRPPRKLPARTRPESPRSGQVIQRP